jgi:hypothetical protein
MNSSSRDDRTAGVSRTTGISGRYNRRMKLGVDDKLREVDFYLGHLRRGDGTAADFRHYMSAFLSASQSADYALVHELGEKDGFKQWRKDQVKKADDFTKAVFAARQRAIHEGNSFKWQFVFASQSAPKNTATVTTNTDGTRRFEPHWSMANSRPIPPGATTEEENEIVLEHVTAALNEANEFMAAEPECVSITLALSDEHDAMGRAALVASLEGFSEKLKNYVNEARTKFGGGLQNG